MLIDAADKNRRDGWRFERAATNADILFVKLFPRMDRRVRRHPAMHLMKRPFPQKRDKLGFGQRATASVGVEVDEAATRRAKTLVIPAELRPQVLRHEKSVAL